MHSKSSYLIVDLEAGSHGTLDVENLDVLPALLEKRDEEVDRDQNVVLDLLLIHAHVCDGDIEAQDLLHLELDCGAQLGNLGLNLLVVGNDSGELASTVKAGS